MENKHNGIIGFWKFIFSLLIVGFHINVMPYFANKNYGFLYGSIAVEFFFIVSGYFLAKKALTKNDNQPVGEATKDYILKKIGKIYPYILFSFVVGFIICNIYYKYNNVEKINSLFDLLLVYCSGIKYNSVMPIAWYISALFIASIIIYPLAYKYKNSFAYILCPIIIFFLGGFLAYNYGQLTLVEKWMGITTVGTLRAIFAMTIGVFSYRISEYLRSINFTIIGKILLTIVQLMGFISIFLMIQKENAHAKYDFVMVVVLFISTIIAFSEKTLDLKILSNKFINYLEKLSLPIFLNQHWILVAMNNIIKINGFSRDFYKELVIAIALSIVFSIITCIIIKTFKKICGKIYKLIIKE